MENVWSASTPTVLIVAFGFPPENVIGARRPHRFAKYLPEAGWRPLILTATPEAKPSAEVPDVLSVPYAPTLRDRLLNRILSKFAEPFSWQQQACSKAKIWLANTQVDAILSTSPPLTVHLVARELAKHFSCPWIADFRDPMLGNDGRYQWSVRLMDSFLEPSFFRDAACLIANTRQTAEVWRKRYPSKSEKICVIYNGFDNRTEFPCPGSLHGDFVLTHTGSLYEISMIDLALDCIARSVKRKAAPAGLGLRHVGLIENLTALHENRNFQMLSESGLLQFNPEHIPADQARWQMVSSHGLLLVDRYRNEGIIQLPAKVFEYIQAGRPILAFTGPNSPLADVLQISGIPSVCVFPEDSTSEQDRKIDAFWHLPPGPHYPSDAYFKSFGASGQAAQLSDILKATCAISPE